VREFTYVDPSAKILLSLHSIDEMSQHSYFKLHSYFFIITLHLDHFIIRLLSPLSSSRRTSHNIS
jgi:hypothetical protein